MKTDNMLITIHQLRQKAYNLREQVIEYYRRKGDPDPYSGLGELLDLIASSLNATAIDTKKLEGEALGISRIVDDDFSLASSNLGKDLYDLHAEIYEFTKKLSER